MRNNNVIFLITLLFISHINKDTVSIKKEVDDEKTKITITIEHNNKEKIPEMNQKYNDLNLGENIKIINRVFYNIIGSLINIFILNLDQILSEIKNQESLNNLLEATVVVVVKFLYVDGIAPTVILLPTYLLPVSIVWLDVVGVTLVVPL